MANNASDFTAAYRAAIAAAREEKKEDPEDHVKRSFASYHPLRYVFRTKPNEYEYAQILNTLDGDGRNSVSSAIRLFDSYASQIGLRSGQRTGRKRSVLPTLARPSLDMLRELAVNPTLSIR